MMFLFVKEDRACSYFDRKEIARPIICFVLLYSFHFVSHYSKFRFVSLRCVSFRLLVYFVAFCNISFLFVICCFLTLHISSFLFVGFRFLTLQISFHFVGFRFLTINSSLCFSIAENFNKRRYS
jgi:hypothetical protein